MLESATVFTGLVATAASFALGYGEAREFQDDMLRQIASLDTGGATALWSPETAPKSSRHIKPGTGVGGSGLGLTIAREAAARPMASSADQP